MIAIPSETVRHCLAGNHQLIVIYRDSHSDLCESVVRWCEKCGSVVVDTDYEGHTNPGTLMKMQSPSITKIIGQRRNG